MEHSIRGLVQQTEITLPIRPSKYQFPLDRILADHVFLCCEAKTQQWVAAVISETEEGLAHQTSEAGDVQGVRCKIYLDEFSYAVILQENAISCYARIQHFNKHLP